MLEQQQVFEEALARNDAAHEARLRRLKREAEERDARQAETATVAVAAASAAAIGAHGRQAGAAVAAMAAAGVHAQTQQASAMAAQAAMFLEFQVCTVGSFVLLFNRLLPSFLPSYPWCCCCCEACVSLAERAGTHPEAGRLSPGGSPGGFSAIYVAGVTFNTFNTTNTTNTTVVPAPYMLPCVGRGD